MKNWGSRFILESDSLNAFDATFGDNGIKYLFLDFDDTVRHAIRLPDGDGRPPLTNDEVSVFPGMSRAIKTWMNAGWTVCGTSNQKGPLRKRLYVPEFMKSQATLEDAAIGCSKVMEDTVAKLGVEFPVYFCSDASIFVTSGGNVNVVKSGLGQETKEAGKAGKPFPAMGEAIIEKYGKPDLKNSFMIGDNYDGGDEGFAKALGFRFVNPGKVGKDFLAFTDKFFNEEGGDVEESQSLQHSYGATKGYNQGF
jgi:histidinol phosphatase-like enzyme